MSAPRWAASLGPHVLVEFPQQKPPKDTPQRVVLSYVQHLVSHHAGSACDYLVPAAAAYCGQGYRENVRQGEGISYAYRSFYIGYEVIYDGNKALVGTTRADLCSHPVTVNCVADNSDPAALFDSGQSFAALWKLATHPAAGYTLTPLVKTGDHWLIDTAAILGG